RLLREAFKKTMTVQSPLLTSTSAGMVLDLTPGPPPESRWKNGVETRMRPLSSSEPIAVVEGPTESERQRMQVHVDSKALSKPESSPGESGNRDRGTSMDMLDSNDKILDQNNDEEEGEEKEEQGEEEQDDDNTKNELGTRIKLEEALKDESPLALFARQEVKSSNSKGNSTCTLTPSNLKADLLESTRHEESLARTCLNTRSKSTSSISSPSLLSPSPSSFSSPALPRVPTRPPSAPLPTLSGQEGVMTAQDIALRTASLGAMTPIEIQRRMYEHAHPKASSSRWPTGRRRSAGVSLEGRSKGESLSLSTSSLQTRSTSLSFRTRQASVTCSLPVSGGGGGAGGSNGDNPNSLVPALPSYYYLPPSAFRTAAAVAAEEQQEAEHRRKKEQEQKEREENTFFEFPSPSPSPPPQASPS
ncbi:hypothetical protein EC968_005435, partial [Mortierella alpina]